MADPFEAAQDGVRLWVKVSPKAAREGLSGRIEGADGRTRLKIAVRAAPEAGKANAAVCALVARRLGLAKSAVTVTAGAASREKTLHLAADPVPPLLDALNTLVHEPGS